MAETDKLKQFLSGLSQMEKDLTKMSSSLHTELGSNFERVIHQQMYEGEKKGKVNKKPATMQLAKDGSIRIVFQDISEGKKFFESFK